MNSSPAATASAAPNTSVRRWRAPAKVTLAQLFSSWLAIVAVLFSLIGAFYYLRVVKVMYFDAPLTATTVAAPADVRVVLSVNGALILLLGIVPGGLMTLCADAIVKTLGT